MESVKLKVMKKNLRTKEKQILVISKKESVNEDLKIRMIESEQIRVEKKKQGIQNALVNDPSIYLWIQKGASSSRLKQSLREEQESTFKKVRKT